MFKSRLGEKVPMTAIYRREGHDERQNDRRARLRRWKFTNNGNLVVRVISVPMTSATLYLHYTSKSRSNAVCPIYFISGKNWAPIVSIANGVPLATQTGN